MRKIYLFLLLALLMTGCKDDFSVSNLPDAKAKMVVYCMPSTADTTYITVLRSVPLKQYNAAQPNVLIDDATISYQLNGQSLPVRPWDKDDTMSSDSRRRVIRCTYR